MATRIGDVISFRCEACEERHIGLTIHPFSAATIAANAHRASGWAVCPATSRPVVVPTPWELAMDVESNDHEMLRGAIIAAMNEAQKRDLDALALSWR